MKICSVIVTYNPNFNKLANLINQLSLSGIYIIIVDNNSEKKLSFNGFSNIDIISLKENSGIAKAQNFGISKAVRNNFEYILLFDQDSTICNDFIDNLYCDFFSITEQDKAAIGPRFIDENHGFFFPALRFNKFGLIKKLDVSNINKPINVSCLISSGTLISVKALKDIGYMKEEFFIDYVDTEWCFRALSKGYKLYMSNKAIMKHSIGDDTIRFLNFKIPVHSGYRRYFRIRNLFFMWKMPYIPKSLTIKLMMTNFLHQILLILLKKNKLIYIKYYLKAIKDGLIQSRNYHG